MNNTFGITDDKFKDIIFGYTNTKAGAKKLSWFYEVDIKIVKEIIKSIKNCNKEHK